VSALGRIGDSRATTKIEVLPDDKEERVAEAARQAVAILRQEQEYGRGTGRVFSVDKTDSDCAA